MWTAMFFPAVTSYALVYTPPVNLASSGALYMIDEPAVIGNSSEDDFVEITTLVFSSDDMRI